MIDEQLLVTVAHRPECSFGPGFYRVMFSTGSGMQTRYCQTQAEVEGVHHLLSGVSDRLCVERDGYCLDGDQEGAGDARTPDVIDAEQWLGLNVADGMRELGLTDEREYARMYHQIEAAVGRRNNRQAQTGTRASIVIKRRGAAVQNV